MTGPIEEWYKSEQNKQANKNNRVYMVPISLDQLMMEDYPAPAWIVEFVLPAGITVVSAAPGSGKTWFILDLALHVSQGLSLYGEYSTPKTGVLIIDEENGLPLLQKRFRLLGANGESHLPIYIWSEENFKTEEKYIDTVIDFCLAHGVRLVIIDTLVRIHDRDENNAVAMAQVFQHLKKLAKHDINVIVTHHNRKPGQNSHNLSHEMRGSSDILAAVDCQISLVKDGQGIVLQQNKLRVEEELKEEIQLLLAKDDQGVQLEYVGRQSKRGDREKEIRIATIALLSEQGLNQKQLLAKIQEMGISVGDRTYRNYLKRWRTERIIEWTRSGGKNTKVYRLTKSVEGE